MIEWSEKLGMNRACRKRVGYWTSIGSPDFVRAPRYKGYLAIHMLELCGLSVVKKNGMRSVWDSSPEFLRSEDSTGSRSFLWRQENLSGCGDSAGFLSKVRQGETREARLAMRQSLLHEAICFDGGSSLSQGYDTRCCERVSFGLEDGQGTGQAVHDGTTPAAGEPRSCSYWYRRDFVEERAHISDRGKRSQQKATDMVWGDRPIRGELKFILRLAGSQEECEDPAGRDGYVEGLREIDKEESASRCDSIRQVSYHAAFGRGVGQDSQTGVPAFVRERPTIHQGAEIYASVPPGKLDTRRKKKSTASSGRKQAIEYGISAEGIIWAAMGLSERGVGKTVLRELEGVPKVAAIETVRGICKADRAPLGRNCCLLQIRKQGFFGIRGRTKQQNSGDSTTGLRTSGRRISPPQDSHLYA